MFEFVLKQIPESLSLIRDPFLCFLFCFSINSFVFSAYLYDSLQKNHFLSFQLNEQLYQG